MNIKLSKTIELLLCALFLLTLSGCLGNRYWTWEHPQQYGPEKLQRDLEECRQLARRETGPFFYYYNDPFYRWPHYHDRFYRPYSSWYYHDRFFSYQRELDRDTRLCMKAKGWVWTEIVPQKSPSH